MEKIILYYLKKVISNL